MPTPQSPDTPESWSAASRGYAARVAPILMEAFAAELVDRLDVSPDTEALEVAAGSGALTSTLARRVKSLVAIDFAPQMIEILRERLQAAGLSNVRCEVMDGQALSLDDAAFDRVASSFALMLFPDKARGFSELRRVLRPGGRAVVSAWASPDKFESFGIFMGAMRRAFPDMPAPPGPPPVLSLANPADFKAHMEAAGFRDVEVDFLSRDMQLADFDDMWSMLTVGAPPVKMLFDRVGQQGKARVREALAEIVAERFGNGPIQMTNVATVGVGTA